MNNDLCVIHASRPKGSCMKGSVKYKAIHESLFNKLKLLEELLRLYVLRWKWRLVCTTTMKRVALKEWQTASKNEHCWVKGGYYHPISIIVSWVKQWRWLLKWWPDGPSLDGKPNDSMTDHGSSWKLWWQCNWVGWTTSGCLRWWYTPAVVRRR